MILVNHARIAVLAERQTILEDLFVLVGKVVNCSAFRTFELNHVVLRHMGKIEMRPRGGQSAADAASTIATNSPKIIA